MSRTEDYLRGLLKELRKLPKETEWVEFKHNNAEPNMIGEYISALANSAAILGKSSAYLVWGVSDKEHEIVGTDFDPKNSKKGNEELENWLLHHLTPKIQFDFYELFENGFKVVILEICRALNVPVQFQKQEYIRVGSYKKTLKEHPEKSKTLWRVFDKIPFENLVALENISEERLLSYLDYPAYFELLNIPLPENRVRIIESLLQDRMVSKSEAGNWNITNLGAILFAKDLSKFPALQRKTVRVVTYKGKNRIETIREQTGVKGYASGFEGLIGYIDNILPRNEVIGKALRKEVPIYPELSVRELVANAIVHQDLFSTGTSPMIEIFSDRMEITNPGTPLVKIERFLDNPPRSRNEALASFLRRCGICEERGSGIDKVVSETEFYQLPAPLFEEVGDNTRATLFSHKPFVNMEREERNQACYLHACLRYVMREYVTNSSLRQRFGLGDKSASVTSRIIKDTLESGKIKPLDPNTAPRHMKYVPYWA